MIEQETIKSELKALYTETKGLYREAVEQAKKGELDGQTVDRMTKMISAFKNLREVAYLLHDIETVKDKKEFRLKEIELNIKLHEKKLEVEIENKS